MIRTLAAGAWYGDMLPTGEWCATVPGKFILTHLGVITLPPNETFGICYPRCTNLPPSIRPFSFSGQAHDTVVPGVWEWRWSFGWRPISEYCIGVQPTIYDRLGLLHISDGSVGSQGYRYVEDDGTPQGRLVSGDATLGPFHGLFEYTQLAPDVWVGHAAYDGGGLQVWDGTTLRQGELGDVRFVNAHASGELVSLAYSKPEGVVLAKTTLTELRALPPVVR